MKRPVTTLILPISTDGKLVSRDAILTDPSPSWRTKPHVIGYLQQFFEFSPTSAYTLTSGDTIALSGVNSKDGQPEQSALNLVVLDSKHALTQSGRKYLKQSVHKLIIIDDPLSPAGILKYLASRGVGELTIHSTPLNALWIEHDLIDYLTLIIYPIVVGESGSPVTSLGLKDPRTLALIETRTFDTNYVCLRYVLRSTK